MKKSVLIFIVAFISLSAFTQAEKIGIKEYKIGEKIGDLPKMSNVRSVGGIDGIIVTYLLKDGTIAGVIFIPSTDGRNTERIYDSDFTSFKEGVQKYYGVDLRPQYDSDYDEEPSTYKANKDRYTYAISYDHNQFMDKPVEMSFIIVHDKLFSDYNKEEAEKASEDF